MDPLRACVGLCLAVPLLVRAAGVEDLPDPMRPPAQWLALQAPGQEPVPPAASRPNVIVHGPAGSVAWLDGQPLRVGQALGGSRVVRIDKHRVILENGKAIPMVETDRIKKYGDGK